MPALRWIFWNFGGRRQSGGASQTKLLSDYPGHTTSPYLTTVCHYDAQHVDQSRRGWNNRHNLRPLRYGATPASTFIDSSDVPQDIPQPEASHHNLQKFTSQFYP